MADWKKVIVSGSTAELAGLTLSGDLTVSGGDITLGSTSIFSGGDTTSLNNIDAIDATTEATIEAAIDTLSNLTAASSLVTVGTLNSGAISSGFGNIDNGTSTLNTGNATVDNFTNNSAVADSHITGSFTGSFVGDGSGLTGLTSANDATITLSPGAGIGAIGDFTTNQSGNETLTIGVDGVLEDLDTLGAASADGEFIVATGAGAFAYESGATALFSLGATVTGQAVLTGSNAAAIRTTLDVDQAGTDNSTNVTLAGTPDYITISGQTITRNVIDISDDTNLTAGTGITLTGDTLSTDDSAIVHDSLSGFVANEHIDHTSVSVIAGNGLTGGGTIAADRTLNIGAGTGVTVNADDIAIGQDVATTANVTFATASISQNLTVGGDLFVQGTQTSLNTTNLLVEDRFILMNSGSATGDGGFIVQTEAGFTGAAFGWDDSEGRFGLQIGTKLAQNATAITPDAYASAVVTSDDANYRKNGNIRVQGGEIYIYVE